ncbi:MAG: hypothetical protein Roseis2KO_18330 [Roseivirga sp.]
MEAIVRQLILHKKENDNATGHPNGKTQYINNRGTFTLKQAPEGYFEIVFNHDRKIDLDEK